VNPDGEEFARVSMNNQKNNHIMFGAVLLQAGLLLLSCGAPTKKASEVGHIFEETDSLQDKTNSACDVLKNRTESPAASDLKFSLNCNEAGLRALNLKEIEAFHFEGLKGDPAKEEKVVHKTIRTQVWLNRSILGLASVIGKKIASGEDIDLGKLEIAPSGVGMDFSKLVKTEIQVTQKPVLDTKDLSFSMALSVKISGVVKIENDIVLSGRLIRENNSFLVTIKSTEDKAFEKSLLQNFSGAIVFIPYAGDIYLDMVLDMNIHNIGFNNAIDSQLNPVLGAGLKKGIDGFLN
jgi:hypothetical protein